MTAHALAKLLLSGPDIPVVISTGSVEDESVEVEGELRESKDSFLRQFVSLKEPHLELT